jgi:hypothetical protein
MVICMRPRSSRTVTRRPAMGADRMLATGERKQTCGVHKPVRLDRDARAAGLVLPRSQRVGFESL